MNQLKKYLSIVLKDKYEKKSIFRIFYELMICTLKYRELPHFYIHKMLYRKNSGNYLDYFSNTEWESLIKSNYLHNPSFADYFRNKLLFDHVFSNAHLNIPETIAYKIGNYIYFKHNSSGYYFSDTSQFKELISKHLLNSYDQIFVKTTDTMGGANCFLLKKENLTIVSESIINFSSILFQELIIQHEEISRINPSSINTIRFDTYRNEKNEIIILNILMRIGVGSSIVDNASSGGFFIKVNSETGVLNHIGRQFLRFGGNVYTKHPDSGFIFGGFKIPFFNESKDLIIKGMMTVNERLVGWDIAITPDGPLIMEGNHSLSLFMSDIAIEGYKRNEEMRKILQKIKEK